MVEGPQEIVRSALGLFVKDLGLVTAEAAAHSRGTPLASAALGLFEQGRDEGHEREALPGVRKDSIWSGCRVNFGLLDPYRH